jgi:hypothetical protein
MSRQAKLGESLIDVPTSTGAQYSVFSSGNRIAPISVTPGFGVTPIVGAGNLGSCVQVFSGLSVGMNGQAGNFLNFRTLCAGGGIAITQDSPSAGDILISSTAPGAHSLPVFCHN